MTRPVFPVALVVEGRACLVVGSGPELLERAQSLVTAGADTHVIAETSSDGLDALAASGKIRLSQRAFTDGDLAGQWLAVYTGADAELAARVAQSAEQRRVFFCAVDRPELNSYAHMALARAGLLTLAISTAGAAPALGRRLREEFERLFRESNLAAFVLYMAALREKTPSAERRSVLGGAVRELRIDGKIHLPEFNEENEE